MANFLVRSRSSCGGLTIYPFTKSDEHLFVFHFAGAVSSGRAGGLEETQAGIECGDDGADAPHGREDLMLKQFRGGFNFLSGADHEFIETGSLQARAFHYFTCRMADLGTASA